MLLPRKIHGKAKGGEARDTVAVVRPGLGSWADAQMRPNFSWRLCQHFDNVEALRMESTANVPGTLR